MDNRQISLSQLSILRRKVVMAVVQEGYSQKEAGKLFGFSKTSVSHYVRTYREQGEDSFHYKKRGRKEFEKSLLSFEDQKVVMELVDKHTPEELGIDCVLWTRRSVRELIINKYEVNYSKKTIGKLLRKWGFTTKKPIQRALERNPAKIKKWLEEEYPSIRQRAREKKIEIFWGDEMGLSSCDHRGRSYSKKGSKSIINKKSHRYRANMIAAITNQGSMRWMVFEENFTIKILLKFLRRLIYKSKNKIFMILDNHKVHHAKSIKNWLNKNQEKIEIFFAPILS